jgi:large subunit ribosomal protein L15e
MPSIHIKRFITTKKPMLKLNYREKTHSWNKQDTVERIEHPTNPARAHALGYKAKQGFVMARIRIDKGGRRKPSTRKARKPKSSGVFFTPETSKQAIAERRVARKFPNLEVLNSYYVGEDGKNKFFEVIMADPSHNAVAKNKETKWIVSQRRRVFRGKTSAARKSRGLQS